MHDLVVRNGTVVDGTGPHDYPESGSIAMPSDSGTDRIFRNQHASKLLRLHKSRGL